MYNLTSPGNVWPVCERGGMRFDLAITDPVDYEGTEQRRFELLDTYRATPGRETYNYRMGFMFPDEFNPTPEKFIIHQFKHGTPTDGHSPPVSLQVEDDVMCFHFRSAATGYDPDLETDGHISIQRNKWYDFNMSIRWSAQPTDHPFCRISCNGVDIVERSNTVNCFDIPGGLRHRIGPYIWNWNNLKTQCVFARL